MLKELAEKTVTLRRAERGRRRRGALGALLLGVVALGSWLHSGAAYALEVPPEAALNDEAELLPITLNPPGESLVFGADERCVSPAQANAVLGSPPEGVETEDAANVQLETEEPLPGTDAPQEESLLEASAKAPCGPLAMSFAAAGEPALTIQAARIGFHAMLGQLAAMAAVPAAIAAVAAGKGGGGGGAAGVLLPGGVPPTTPPFGAPPAGGLPGQGGEPPIPTPEPTSWLLLAAGAGLVGRAVKRRVGR
jgi:hypothetical protein